nr:reverse transcriptase domain-containing protein [Tanacetum cinerariifolium]
MPQRMRTRSAGRPDAESRGGRTGGQVSRGGERGRRPRVDNDERVDDLNGQGNDLASYDSELMQRVATWSSELPKQRVGAANKGTSQSKHNSQGSSTTFIYKTLSIPSFLDSCFISSTVSEDKRVMLCLDLKICAKDKNFSSIWAYTAMMLLRDLLPAMLAQVGNQGNVGNQNGNVVNENVQENDRNVFVNGNRVGCSYKEFLACNPKEYDGKGGVVFLTRWIKKIENVQDMSGCSIDQKVKYTAGSFVGKALMWFHESERLVPHLVTTESRKIERYVYGLAPQIRGMVAATEPKTMQKAV